MERLNERYTTLIKAQKAFKRAQNLYEKKFQDAEQAEREAYTASVIKHFELFYEMLWKFFKGYLQEKYGMITIGSKTIFRACYDQKLIDEATMQKLLEIVEIRSQTTHVYNEATAIQVILLSTIIMR